MRHHKKRQKNFRNNMAVIKKIYPAVAEWLGDITEPPWVRLTDDDRNMVVDNGSGFKLVYDKDIPTKDAKAACDDESKLHRQNTTVIIGAGLGYLPRLITKRMDLGHQVVVIDPVPWMVRTMLHRHDYTKHIERGMFFICTSVQDVAYLLPTIEETKTVEEWVVLVEPHAKERPEYMEIQITVLDAINQARCNAGTVASSGVTIAKNDILTLPFVIRHRGVVELIDLFKGKPAVLVSTGPSLARNIHLLKEVQDKVIIVAVAQALRPLLAYDIRPDFICSVDFGEVNMTHLNGLLDQDVPLVTINRTYAPLVQKYKGPKFISANVEDALLPLAQGLMADKGTLIQGGSVAHMCFGLAGALGCDPLIMIGQDLALTEDSHMAQADSMGQIKIKDGEIRWSVGDPRSSLSTIQESYSMGSVQKVPGYFGEPVLTNSGLISFLTSFKALCTSFHGTVIDATEGGAYIEGTEPRYLTETLEEFCTELIDKTGLLPLLTPVDNGEELLQKAHVRLQEDVKVFDNVIKHCDEGITSNKEVTDLLRAKDGNKNMVRLNALSGINYKQSMAAREEAEKNPLLGMSIHGLVRAQSVRAMNPACANDAKTLFSDGNKDVMDVRITRNLSMMEGTKNAAQELKDIYIGVIQKIQEYFDGDASVLEPTGDIEPPNLDDAKIYFKQGNFARPLLEALRYPIHRPSSAVSIMTEAHTMRREAIWEAEEIQAKDRKEGRHLVPRYFYLINKGQALGKETQNYIEATKLLAEAMELQPDRMEARWGLASAYYWQGKFTRAIGHYKILMEKFPDVHEFEYEIGLTYLAMGDNVGLDHIHNTMGKTTRFYNFLPKLAELYVKTGNVEKAYACLEMYIKENQGDEKTQRRLTELKGQRII